MNLFVSWFCKIFIKPIVGFLFIREVKGLENIPKGNFILASNHQSHLDWIVCG
jgi:1-acyl-sn-glycerol-3-phosphate acyltransferase